MIPSIHTVMRDLIPSHMSQHAGTVHARATIASSTSRSIGKLHLEEDDTVREKKLGIEKVA
jgi:hypothetical protein